ncbi:MAG: hypothetical protein EBX52_11085, partial [Proteobacteria bacterium]|nr:hypothetical protein [Pseudomonadota bacterium]
MMPEFIRAFLIVLIFCLPHRARAGSLLSDTSSGSGVFTQEIGYSGEIPGNEAEKDPDQDSDPRASWGYDFSYSFSASGVGSTLRNSNASNQTDHTHTVSAAIQYEATITPGFKASYSLTPEEFLSVVEAGGFR